MDLGKVPPANENRTPPRKPKGIIEAAGVERPLRESLGSPAARRPRTGESSGTAEGPLPICRHSGAPGIDGPGLQESQSWPAAPDSQRPVTWKALFFKRRREVIGKLAN